MEKKNSFFFYIPDEAIANAEAAELKNRVQSIG
jgi:hypothetical protein